MEKEIWEIFSKAVESTYTILYNSKNVIRICISAMQYEEYYWTLFIDYSSQHNY